MKFKTILKQLKKVGPFRLIFLIVLIMSNTFAWFIYATKIDSSVSVHVRSLNVVFEAGENEISNTVNFTVDNVYPGMEDFTYEIKAYNKSEVPAILVYQLLEANILGTQYITVEGRAERGEAAVATDVTSSQLESMLANNYPFSITINVSNNLLEEEDGLEEYTLGIEWPYESNNDAEDTRWGIAAYNYKESNPGEPSITLKVKITITQSLDQDSELGSEPDPGSGSGSGSEPDPGSELEPGSDPEP